MLAMRSTQFLSTAVAVWQKPDIINKNMVFHKACDSNLAAKDRPLVVIYAWLAAKSKHLHKYNNFYLEKGFDVLQIKVRPTQLMWPVIVQGLSQEMLDFIHDADRALQPLLIHGFSVGGYLYGEILHKICANPDKYSGLKERIRGQIFDSPVDFQGIPFGVSRAVSDNPVVQRIIEHSLASYLKVFKKQTTDHYLRSSAAFHANDLAIPSLLLCSHADPVGPVERIEYVVGKWRNKDIPVVIKLFDNSPHVSHFLYYPADYMQALNRFLGTIGLDNEETDEEQFVKTSAAASG